MHRSALGAIGIDVPSEHLEASTAFWRQALGRDSRQGTQHAEYQPLSGRFSQVRAFVQDVGTTAPRAHLDLHTDDVEAEVARLIGLGAREVARHGDWVVLEDPAGMAFCVCPEDPDDPVLEGAAEFA